MPIISPVVVLMGLGDLAQCAGLSMLYTDRSIVTAPLPATATPCWVQAGGSIRKVGAGMPISFSLSL